MDRNEHRLVEHPAARRAALAWGVSLEEGFAYECDQQRWG